ncbi:membrane hypothetical protein [Gammaproteobacteria bacterium]
MWLIKQAWNFIKPKRPATMTGAVVGGLVAGGVAFALGAGIPIIAFWGITGALGGGYVGKQIDIELECRKLGVKVPRITVTRTQNEKGSDGKERAVFNFDNVVAFDGDVMEAMTKNAAEAKDTEDSKKLYSFKDKPKYKVKVVAKTDIALGELDFAGFRNNPNFEVIVTNEKGEPVSENEKNAVLATLDTLPKFSGDNLPDPRKKAIDEIKVASKPTRWNWVNAGVDWVRAKTSGKVVRQEISYENGPSTILETKEFLDRLMEVAINTGNYKILENYKTALQASHEKKFLALQQKQIVALNIAKEDAPTWLGVLARAAVAVAFFGLASVVTVPLFPTIFGLLSLATFAYTAFKGYQLFDKIMAERKLKKMEKEKDDKIKELDTKFKGLDETKKAIEECAKGKQATLSLESREISDICAGIVAKFISSAAGQNCKELNLSKNNITDVGVVYIAQALLNAPAVQTVNLSKNLIGIDGVRTISEVLSKNFSITTFEYDDSGLTLQNIGDSLRPEENIKKQLIINKYLQNQQISAEELKSFGGSEQALRDFAIEKIKEAPTLSCLQNVSNITPEIKSALMQAQLHLAFSDDQTPKAQQLEGYINIYPDISSKDFGAVNQGKVLTLVKEALFKQEKEKEEIRFSSAGLAALRKMKDKTREDLFNRCFLANTGATTAGIPALVAGLIGLGELDNKNRALQKLRECIEQVATWGTTNKRWDFQQYLSKIKEARYDKNLTQEIAEKIDVILQNAVQTDLKGQFTWLQTKPFKVEQGQLAEFKRALEGNIDLKNFEYPDGEMDPDVIAHIANIIKRNKIRDILEHPPTPESKALTRFFELYRDMDPKYLAAPAIDVGKLVTLVQTDAYNKTDKTICVLLQSLDNTHRCALLEKCFANTASYPTETNAVRKAALVSNMIATVIAENSSFNFDNATRSDKGTLEHYIYYSTVAKDYSFNDLKIRLDNQRKKLKKEEKDNEADKFDWILQADLRAELGTKFPFLCSPFEKPSSKQLEELKTVLDKVPTDLKSEFPDKVDGNVKAYIAHIINRNKLSDAISDYATPEKKLEKFLTVYSTITPDAERQECLKDFKKLARGNEAALKALVQHDVDKPYDFKNLKALKETQRTEILEACLGDDPNAHGIAALVSKLIKIATPIGPDYVWRIFDWTAKGNWDFEEYITQLKTLRDTNPSISEKIDEIIQTGMKEDLVARFGPCLRGEGDQQEITASFDTLTTELKQNYDLTVFTPNPAIRDVRIFIDSIIHRNLALQAAAEPCDLDALNTFIREYKAIGTDLQPEKVSLLLEEVFSPLDEEQKLSILRTVTLDLGSYTQKGMFATDNRDNYETKLECNKLMELDGPHRIALLTQCFTNDTAQDAKDKAILVSTILEGLQKAGYKDHAEDSLIKNLAYEIYWAISPKDKSGTQPYRNFKDLQIKLKEIEAKIDKGGYPYTPAELRGAIKESLTVALKLSVPKPKEEALDELDEEEFFDIENNSKDFQNSSILKPKKEVSDESNEDIFLEFDQKK